MSVSTAQLSMKAPANSRSRVILASLIGTTIEFYDFYVYATAAVLVFPHLFFPPGNETTALLSSFAIFGAAMVARPLGAIFFGHLGDKRGRKITLVGALLTMGIATFLIGALPTFATVGWFAPAMLVVLRLAQGFALGGEWSGAALVATENAPEGKRAIFGTFPQLGAPIGFIIANGLFLIIAAILPSDDPSRPSLAFLDWGWRIPFLFSAVMVIVGLWVRLNLVESTAFEKTVSKGEIKKVPLVSVFQSHWKQLVLGTFYMLATYVLFYLMTTFSLSYGLWNDRLAWQVTLFMGLQSALAYCVFGWLAPILRDRGLDGTTAGVVVSVSVMAQVFTCLLVPSIAVRCRNQSLINVALVTIAVAGLLGLLFAPLSTVWLWAVVQGIGQGGLIAIAMTMIVLRSPDSHVASHLSGMAQCVGYMLAAIGPLLVGLIHSVTESYAATAILFVLLGIGVAIFGWGAGRALQVQARTITL